jgi:hypoxanthine phosphoribosyltransferase
MASTLKLHPAHVDLESVLVTEDAIKKRIKKLGTEVAAVYGEEEITVISIINGAILFTADLLRAIPNPIRLDCIRISSYRNETKSIGKPQMVHSLTLDITNRHVLLIDDILDTGKTLAMVAAMIRKQAPASVKTCVLLDKRGRREVEFEADFVGFRIPDKFVVGYGLDFAERYRNLPCIGVLRPHLQNPPEWA